MDDYESLSHSKWECKYHVVFIPKYRPTIRMIHCECAFSSKLMPDRKRRPDGAASIA